MKQETALEILKSGKNVFITGAAGTGKSYLLNQYIDYLENIKEISPVIVAPTGIAASHLGGQTIHSYFGLGIRQTVTDSFINKLGQNQFYQKKMRKLEVLIIDEISMVSPTLFSTIDEILKAFKDPFEPFGGVQVVLSGDFFQLPPIQKEHQLERFAWQSDAWRELEFNVCYLQEKFRQTNDVLINILDDIRAGKISDESFSALKSRCNIDLDVDFTPTRLYTHNFNVDRVNHTELEKLNTPLKSFLAETDGEDMLVDKVYKMSMVKETLYLKVGATVIFIKNSTPKGYVNGTTGVITEFNDDGVPVVLTSSGHKITADVEEWKLKNDMDKVVAKVTQIPLRLAWALTIHKSQGMTLDSAEIDLSKTFEVGQGYVALSRIKSIKGLKLLGLNEVALQVDSTILKIDDRIKNASKRAEKLFLKGDLNL